MRDGAEDIKLVPRRVFLLAEKIRIFIRLLGSLPVLQFCIGVIAASLMGSARVCAIALIASVLFLFFRSKKAWAISLGISVVLLRLISIENDFFPENHISVENGREVTVQASVTQNISVKSDRVSVVVAVKSLCVEFSDDLCVQWEEREGNVQVWFPRYPPARLGEVWEITGNLQKPEEKIEDFAYSDYLAGKDVYSVVYRGRFMKTDRRVGNPISLAFWDVGYALRLKIERSLPEPHSSLLAGMLFGFRSGQFPEFSEDLQRCGVTHVIAASGYNVSVVMTFITLLTSKLHRRVGLLISMVGVWSFSLIAGASTPVIRAALMSSYACVAKILGRPASVHVSFFISMACFIVTDPKILNDVSFQLSYSSTAGLLYIVPVIEKIVPTKLKSIEENAVVTFSAICSTLPISLVHFGSFSSVALIVNVLTLPLVAPAMGIGMLPIVIPSSFGIISKIASVVAWVPLDIFVKIVHYFAQFRYAMVDVGKITLAEALGMYVLLGCALSWIGYKESGKEISR